MKKEKDTSKIELLLEAENLQFVSIDENNSVKYYCRTCKTLGEISEKQLVSPHPARTGKICQLCRSKDRLISKTIELYGFDPYEYISYEGYNEPATVKCRTCGEVFTKNHAYSLVDRMTKFPPCKKCAENRKNARKTSLKDFEELLIKKFGACNFEFDDKSFNGLSRTEKIKGKCKFCGHEFETFYTNILNPKNGKHYCRVCNNKDRLLERMSYKQRCEMVTNKKITPLEEYKDSRTPIKHKCNICGHEWFKIPIKNTPKNAGCPKCAKKNPVSKAEKEILAFIKSLGITDAKTSVRNILPSKKELDIYIPSLKTAFEIDGLYWHNEEYKGKKYHIEKSKECWDNDIRIIHVFDDEYYQKKEIVKRKIASILGKNYTKKIFARKCEIVDVSSQEKNDFLAANHIQGSDSASIRKGLKFEGKLVAVMTFCKRRLCLGKKSSSDGEYELSRYATSENVVGGFSRLFKACVEENKITTVTTYADLRWSDPKKNVYLTNGFTLTGKSSPGYWYFDASKDSESAVRIHRFNFRKQELETKFPNNYDASKTEFQIMDETNYRRIWDCGNLVLKWEKEV